MDICIQNYTAMEKERDWDNASISLRLQGAEARRFWKVMDTAKARNPYAKLSDIYKELLGLQSLVALTEADVEYFRSGTKDIAPQAFRQTDAAAAPAAKTETAKPALTLSKQQFQFHELPNLGTVDAHSSNQGKAEKASDTTRDGQQRQDEKTKKLKINGGK